MRRRRRKDLWSWLELIDREGPFVAIPALKRVWPQGMPVAHESTRAVLRDAKPTFDRAWDTWNTAAADDDAALGAYRAARDTWVATVLREAAGWGSHLILDPAIVPGGPLVASSPDGRHTVTAAGAFARQDNVAAIVLVVDPVASLRDAGTDGWSATPIDRLELLLRRTEIPVGVVTDGRWWALVSAPVGTMVASGVVDSQTWIEETEVRDAFLTLLAPQTLAGGRPENRLPALFIESVAAAEEVTESLGTQVRRAVELLVAAFAEAALHAKEDGRPDPLPEDRDEVYQAAVTVMMRVIFLLFAEERSLMPASALYTEGYAVSGRLEDLERRLALEGAESLDATNRTWHRLLATSNALYTGVTAEDMRLPSYGGSLFDPKRFPFLLTRDDEGLVVTVSDRVILEVFRAVQRAEIGGERRRISFRDMDVEQIGYIYEGLLGYSCRQADRVVLGLTGSQGMEPEIPLDVLEDLAERSDDDTRLVASILAWVKQHQPAAKPPSAAALKKQLVAGRALPEADQLLRAASGDPNLRKRIRPYLGIIRRDLRERLVVIAPGGLVVVETPSRATSGAHYTPKSLAQDVVRYALEPLVYSPGPHQTSNEEEWEPISSDDLLSLKVADIACGSGAFLVSAAEYLADRLVEAWQREQVATGSAQEQRIRALREVVASCLYGADINPMAVEMCKISLWLVSLDPDLPFSFVDDKVLCGNSLLGLTSPKQLEALHIDPEQVPVRSSETGLFDAWSNEGFVESLDVASVLRKAADLRRRLATPVDDSDPQRATRTKQRLWHEYQKTVADLRHVADGVVALGLRHGGKPGKKLNEGYDSLRVAVNQAYAPSGACDSAMLDEIVDVGLKPEVDTDYERWQPLHWVLAVPDVVERGGFDAIIGNPPFLGASETSAAIGTRARAWIAETVGRGSKGKVDLCAYFFLRAASLLRESGGLGLLATTTIAQGATRQAALDQLLRDGFSITRAISSQKWPSKAQVQFAAVWLFELEGCRPVVPVLDGKEVPSISSFLEADGSSATPVPLAENSNRAFLGCKIGTDFVFEEGEVAGWPERDRSLLKRLVTGHSLNWQTSGVSSSWVLDCDRLSLSQFQSFSVAYQALRARRSSRTREWWRFDRPASAMRKEIEKLGSAIMLAEVSQTIIPMRISTQALPNHKCAVIADSSFGELAILSSSVHWFWVARYCSTQGVAPSYTPSQAYHPFPRPGSTPTLENVGQRLHKERYEIMSRRNLGLTELYKRVNNPVITDASDTDVARLRKLHVELDISVVAAYGWDDLALSHGFYTYRQMNRWTVSPDARVELLNRLLEENHRRAGEGVMSGRDDMAEGENPGEDL